MKTVTKPWGSFTVIKEPHQVSDRTKVALKKLIIKPGQSLSLQSHEYKSEFWNVLSGIATIQIINRFIPAVAGTTYYIKAGRKHRLSNDHTTNEVIVLEMSVGQKIDESDIKRYEDKYGRV